MRKPVVTTVLLLLLLAVVVAAAGLGGAATAPPAQAGPAASSSHWCNFILAGKDATADGSVLMGYNNDWSANNYVYMQVVPGDATHNQYVRLLTWGGVPEGGINVHQLGVNYGTATTLDAAVLAADPFVKKGYGGEIWDTILQQCSTAQEAITLLGQMAQTGFTSGAAGSFGIADPQEAWVFELLGGHHWVAQRVPDDAVLAHPNIVTVRQIDLATPTTSAARPTSRPSPRASAGTIPRAAPSTSPGPTTTATCCSPTTTPTASGAPSTASPRRSSSTPTMPYADRPVYVVPDDPVTRQDIQAICRYHYEGTAIDQTQDYTLMSPHAQTNRPICHSTTDYSAVWQLRSWKPDDIGGVMWVAPSRPCSSAYVPFYGSITSVPSSWTNKTAFNLFRAVADSLDKRGTVDGEIRYKHYIPLVQGVYGAFEAECTAAQASTESTAAGLSGAARITYLTDYSAQRATQAQNLAAGLPAQMP